MFESITKRKIKKDFRHLGNILYEKCHGLDFSTFVELPVEYRNMYFPYERSSSLLLYRALDRNVWTKKDSFLDIGCGKGYVLYLVRKRYDFENIDGVELLESLCTIARNNMKKLHMNSHIYHCLAEDFSDYDLYNCFYMFNPCQSLIINRIALKIARSLSRVPREAWLLYSHPNTFEIWENMSSSKEQIEGKIDGYNHRLIYYKLEPEKAVKILKDESCYNLSENYKNL